MWVGLSGGYLIPMREVAKILWTAISARLSMRLFLSTIQISRAQKVAEMKLLLASVDGSEVPSRQ